MRGASLKSRITLSLVIIVTVTGGLFAFGVLLLKQKLEEVIFGDMVHDQLEVILEQVDNRTYDDSTLFTGWTLYRENGEPSPNRLMQELPVGSHHHIHFDDHYYQVEVQERHGEKYYLALDITEWENLEHRLLGWLAAGIGILAVTTVFMGLGASRTILAPVRDFTNRLKSIGPHQRQVRVAADFQGNEIGQIANAFDQYLARMDRFVEREQSFTAAASHELRNPLSVMLGALDVLESSEVDERTKRVIMRLRRAIDEMQAFIEAALFLSREESTTVMNEASPVALRDLLASLLEDNTPMIARQQVTVDTSGLGDISLRCPANLLKIALGNLLRNAIEHTPGGCITLRSDSRSLTITDEGEGISPENLPRIYDRNFSTKPEGSGMGLNLVRRICDRFGWKISVTSEPGQGTSMTVDFSASLAPAGSAD